jgi:hypothetical protein
MYDRNWFIGVKKMRKDIFFIALIPFKGGCFAGALY